MGCGVPALLRNLHSCSCSRPTRSITLTPLRWNLHSCNCLRRQPISLLRSLNPRSCVDLSVHASSSSADLVLIPVAADFNISHFMNRYDVKIHFAEPNSIFNVVKHSRGFLVHNKLQVYCIYRCIKFQSIQTGPDYFMPLLLLIRMQEPPFQQASWTKLLAGLRLLPPLQLHRPPPTAKRARAVNSPA